MNKTWFITGASRGLGLEIARAALAAGDSVAATARSPEKLAEELEADRERLHAIELDVTDADAATRAVQEAVDRFGGIDVLVNNAGQAQLGWFETISDEDIRRQFDINLFGMLNVARAALPAMRERRSGLLVTVSSINGVMANAGGSIYSASKFAIEGWIEGLAQEVEPLGLRSLVIEPGMLRTDFLDAGSARHGAIEIADYSEAVSQFRSFISGASGNQPGDPTDLAARIVELAALPSPPQRFVYGEDALEWATAKVDRLRGEIENSRRLQVRRAQ